MYIKRDSHGNITAVSISPESGFDEEISADSPALRAFLKQQTERGAPESGVAVDKSQLLQSSDAELARVLEDIIDLLTAKGIFQFTELPAEAQKKLLSRKHLRQRIRKLDLLGDDNDDMLP